jgi:hypothetical protein
MERYPGPETFGSIGLRGNLSQTAGFFRFGPDITCYGRSSAEAGAQHPGSGLHDLESDVTRQGSQLLVPFDPSDFVDNLRLERYVAPPSGLRRLAKSTYYFLRPAMSASARKRIQALQLRNWRNLEFPRWPVDTTVEDLCERLLMLYMRAQGIDRIPFIWFWPDAARGCILLTHDVDSEAGRDFCPSLMDIDEAHGLKAGFGIVPEERYSVSPEFLSAIRSRGFEIGIQDLNHDGRLYDDRDEFLRRAQIINRYAQEYGARGFRSAILYRKFEWLDALNFSFDMSCPNVAHLDPQRGGCCTVLPYFVGNILELPVTTTQDYMLLNLLGETSIRLWQTQIKRILVKCGLVSFIVHPDYISGERGRRVFESLLRHLQELRSNTRLWFALPSAIDDWWRLRSKMRVVPEGDGWKIEGADSDRAVLAYATLDGDRLVYELPA